ncbi:hypothetical protein MSG28_010842 [Choristoneura fumiferana]|uniref:Uncharacterized protein n=1 Tax=Choristoneura fumiferana TaxID=7141 RepID=A0ACC0KPZ5_CHOFU|nr:hypothetical protein MSG28_010842 [Choristoneura fumiferana]
MISANLNVLLAALMWLLPATTTGGVVRDTLFNPCRTYSLNDQLHLDCSDQGLSELPDGLNYDAQVLDFSNNNFETFPNQLEHFTQAVKLDISGNHLNLPLPGYIANWPNLHTLNLSDNNYDVWFLLKDKYQSENIKKNTNDYLLKEIALGKCSLLTSCNKGCNKEVAVWLNKVKDIFMQKLRDLEFIRISLKAEIIKLSTFCDVHPVREGCDIRQPCRVRYEMGTRLRELLVLLAACTLVLGEPAKKSARADKDAEGFLYQYEDYDAADDRKVLFSEDKPCPRDCICTASQGYRIAKCNRLEIGTQKFGDDITDLVIQNADPAFPIDLDDFIFKKLGLHQIATVKIVNSTIGYVGPNAFHGLQDLYAVNLSNNKLKSLHPDTFANNKKLLLLTLAYNPLKFPAPNSQDYFLNASSVQELDVSYCNMQYITANTFKNLSGVMYLNVAGNNLSDMDPDTFKKLLDLEELDLSDNNIQSLPNDIFSENTELATLHIQRNPIDTVYDLQVSDLLTLNAGQTNIKFVGPSMFNGMTYIANLNLSGNSIEKIHNQAFHKLVELNYLDLSYNNLDFISSILIKENIELDIFKISNNPNLRKLPEEGFNCSADQFNIYLFDASNCGLEDISDNALKTFTALSQINLSHNNIKTISNQVFSRCPKLVDVNLAYNMLTTLDVKIFEKNIDLARLNLQGNPIKVFSAEVFVHTPMLTWLDVSNAELTSLWKVDKNQPKTLLNNLSFLNVSHNRISEIKQTEVDNLNKLRTLDISNNPLACGREFENLMSWLSKHKVSPNADSASIANLARDGKDDEVNYSWEFLTKKTCGSSAIVHPVEPLPPVSDEEIWERIDKDSVGNFDLKDTLDDGKIDENPKDAYSYPDDDGEDADDADLDEEDDDDDEEEDDSGEDEDSDDMDLSVKLNEKPAKPKTLVLSKQLLRNYSTTTKPVPTASQDFPENKVEIEVKLMDNDNSVFEDSEPDFYPYLKEASMVKEDEHGHYEYLWPILIAVLGALLLLLIIAKIVMVVCSRRDKQVRYNSAIIAAMSQQGRTKKDCGLVYQQLSEDLTGPATPKLARYAPLHSVSVKASNMYESSPFHHNNIVPEAV